jgi:hypothetical protein
VQIRASLDPK